MNTLLLIPDISGFTQFVNETEINHSRHIISELLELIIDSDILGLTVAEIEGDAVLFYKHESVPTVSELVEQARQLFINFHAHLKQYDTRRICQCGACTSAHQLTLKIVAHSGPVEFVQVKDFHKPYGPDLILAHRLLKNDIDDREYLLLSEAILSIEDKAPLPDMTWVKFTEGTTTYDDVGTTAYCFVPLHPLHADVPEPPPIPPFQLTENPVVFEDTIDLPLLETYDLVSDLTRRLEWNEGIDKLDFEPERVNRVGTKHQCIVGGKLIDFETVSANVGPDKLVYGEVLAHPPIVQDFGVFWILSEAGEGTRLRLEAHYHPRPGILGLLAPLFRLITIRTMGQSFAHFKTAAAEQPVLA